MTKRRGHGEGSIYERGDGLWVGVVDLGWQPAVDRKTKKPVIDKATGRQKISRKRKYIYAKTYEEVRVELSRITRERDQGFAVPTARMTVGQYLDRWLADVQAGRLSSSTKQSYEQHVRVHIVPIIGRKQLAKLTVPDVQELIRAKEAAGLSARTIRQTLVIIRMALKQAVLGDLIPRNVATLVTPPKVQPFDAAALNDDQIAAFLAAAESNRLHALFRLAVLVGPRMGELLGLRWQDLELEAGKMHIRQAVIRLSRSYEFAPPKTAGSKRSVSLPASCVTALRQHRKEQLQERLLAGARWQDHDLVFTSSIGTPLDDRLLTREHRAVLEAAGLRRIRFHDLRHTAITSMIIGGTPPHVVAKIVGHSRITMTLGTYAKVVGSSLDDAAASIDSRFGSPTAAIKESG